MNQNNTRYTIHRRTIRYENPLLSVKVETFLKQNMKHFSSFFRLYDSTSPPPPAPPPSSPLPRPCLPPPPPQCPPLCGALRSPPLCSPPPRHSPPPHTWACSSTTPLRSSPASTRTRRSVKRLRVFTLFTFLWNTNVSALKFEMHLRRQPHGCRHFFLSEFGQICIYLSFSIVDTDF